MPSSKDNLSMDLYLVYLLLSKAISSLSKFIRRTCSSKASCHEIASSGPKSASLIQPYGVYCCKLDDSDLAKAYQNKVANAEIFVENFLFLGVPPPPLYLLIFYLKVVFKKTASFFQSLSLIQFQICTTYSFYTITSISFANHF